MSYQYNTATDVGINPSLKKDIITEADSLGKSPYDIFETRMNEMGMDPADIEIIGKDFNTEIAVNPTDINIAGEGLGGTLQNPISSASQSASQLFSGLPPLGGTPATSAPIDKMFGNMMTNIGAPATGSLPTKMFGNIMQGIGQPSMSSVAPTIGTAMPGVSPAVAPSIVPGLGLGAGATGATGAALAPTLGAAAAPAAATTVGTAAGAGPLAAMGPLGWSMLAMGLLSKLLK